LESRKLGVGILKRDGNFPEGKIIGGKMVKLWLLLLFDGLLQGINVLGVRDLDSKVVGIITQTQNPTV
jgi:hypothetical protein